MIDPKPLCRAACQSFGAVAASALLLLVAPAASQTACTILDDCTGIDSLPSADVCGEDDCSCAQQVERYLRGESPTTNWPGGGEPHSQLLPRPLHRDPDLAGRRWRTGCVLPVRPVAR